ncbi:MAG: PEP-CTERM sorting domain-containing protein [Candidatus Nanoarchaeia archaeon]|jgi:hypothetical protein|nr:PEP-CTERM sorting domain-containing protein [Candidatus Nanoarchaeia archaeon]
MDFEANGIENGSILYDYVDPFVLDDYGSAQLQMTSKTYYDNLIVFTTAYCNHYEGWFYSETLFDNYISFSGSIAEISRTLEFKNYQPAFKIGDIFKINESYNSASINGNVTLASIKSFNEPPASVPEPTMLSLLSVGLLGIGLSRKK